MQLKSIIGAVLYASLALGASLQQVSNYGGSASPVQMYVYIPDNVKPNPALVVVIHSCSSSAQNYFGNPVVPWRQGSDAKGYITIWPSSPNSGGCWDVSSRQSLTRNGGGDSTAIANMITYALRAYNADPERVFVTGGSSGAMMSNVMAACYPDLIKAVSLYSGVPAGCFSSSSGGVAQWNSQCSQGQLTHTPAEWATIVKNMYPGYTGKYPRMQFWHGSADTTLYPQNYQETVKQWTAVFGVSQTATSTQQNSPDPNYTRSDYGPSIEGIYAQGVGHSVPPHLADSERWFGLDGSTPPPSSSQPPTSSTTSPPLSSTVLPPTTTAGTSTPSTQPTATAQHWGQCGGTNWTGPTVCASPYTCQCQNQWYCQCL